VDESLLEFFRENIFDFFGNGLIAECNGIGVRQPVKGISLSRDDDLDLVFEIKSSGLAKREKERFPPGTVRISDDTLKFKHHGGWTAIAHGVTYWGSTSTWKRDTEGETVQTFTAHSIEVAAPIRDCMYVIDWVQNLPNSFISNDHSTVSAKRGFTAELGRGDAQIKIEHEINTSGGDKVLHLTVDGIELYAVSSPARDKKKDLPGYIVYRGNPPDEFRKKIRICLSFVLGRMIVFLGHTEYRADWSPCFMKSVDAVTINGAVFKQVDMPPYPINDSKYANIIDGALINRAVNALAAKYDSLKFNEASWSYWYAVCAPLHAAAIQFGALIEQLQRNASALVEFERSGLIGKNQWKELRSLIQNWINSSELGPLERDVLKNKSASLNQVPQSVAFQRLLDTLGLAVGEAEFEAWKHRNRAAHGGISDKPGELVLSNKLLRLLFHRMVAALTGCSGFYHDYYSLNHPVRPLTQAVPKQTLNS
jgi:hypothetical protein